MIKLNNQPIKQTVFPDGTSQAWEIKNVMIYNTIEFEYESEHEVMQLFQLLDYIEQHDFETNMPKVCLIMPYLPYARQDKEYAQSETFALRTFLRLLDGFTCVDRVVVKDVHSKHILPKKFVNIYPNEEIGLAVALTDCDTICFPDEGASKRYEITKKLYKDCGMEFCSMTKDRDQQTGYIKRLYLNELIDLEDKRVLIVDDLCDGGMTFKLTAEKLLTSGAKEVILYTTHGIYSKGVETLRESGISRIFNRKGEVK